jgi:hypothetical protein
MSESSLLVRKNSKIDEEIDPRIEQRRLVILTLPAITLILMDK